MDKEPKVCELHKTIEREINKGKFLRKVFGSKIFISIIGTVLLFLISWGIWVTNGVYVRAAERDSEKTTAQKTSKDIDEMKGEMKEIKNEIKNQNETINKNQQDMLKLLINIQRSQRRINDNQKSGTK